MNRPTKFLRTLLLILIPLIGIGILAAGLADPVRAAAPPGGSPSLQTTPLPEGPIPMGNEACLECHENLDMVLPLPSGERVSLHIERTQYGASVHGQLGYACVQCHTDITGFPHPPQDFQEARDITVALSQACGTCHEQQLDQYSQGQHALLLAEGDKNNAVCADCHGAHTTETFTASPAAIAGACQQCHADIYDAYTESVHGKALLDDFNVDVPTCIDCHNHHNNAGPTAEGFHLFSPQVCAKCHTDETLMAKYDINTNVFDTFTSDFHGTTVSIFERTSPDQETNKPVCIDCHGVHDIKSPDDAGSTVIKQNLLVTCQRCHEDATSNFPDAWLVHYEPDAENHLVVYIVNLFYKFMIPGTLGIMALFVVTDFWRSRIRKK